MCTVMAMQATDFYFGRNLDLEYDFGQRVVITPRNFPFHFRCDAPIAEHPAIIGMATVEGGYPLYAEAANEYGLCIAGLNFPRSAYYFPEVSESRRNISPFELIPWLLCQCRSVKQAKALLAKTRLVDRPFSESPSLTPLHWQISDADTTIAVEPTESGLQIWDNSTGVLTNEPPYPFHAANLCRYLHLSPSPPRNHFADLSGIAPFGPGMGAIGLPGDLSSPSRFVRGAFLLHHSQIADPSDESLCVGQLFHLLAAVEMPRGSVILPDGRLEYTRYSSCINAARGIYYCTTYEDRSIRRISLRGREVGEKLMEFAL